MNDPSVAESVQRLFKDAYEALEEIQGHADFIEPFSDAIVTCHWAISNLERIHRTHAQNPYSALGQDAFSLRNNLDRFVASCHALIRFVNPLRLPVEAGCNSFSFGNNRATLKRKQIRELQEEFWDHQRILSLVLANAIYMTTLDMQKANKIPDPELESILRQSQKQHTVYEKTVKVGQESKSQKPAASHVDQLEWEVCLRKYFEYLQKQSEKDRRRQSEPMRSHSSTMVRLQGRPQSGGYAQELGHNEQYNNPAVRPKLLSYGSSDGNSYNEIYTRPRRNSTASRASTMSVRSRNNSITSVQSFQTATTSTACTPPVPSISYRWDQPSKVTLPNRHSPPPPREEIIHRAWKDIVNATQTMSILEARAYIEGRLAGLDPGTIAEIRKAMSGSKVGSQIITMALSPGNTTPPSDVVPIPNLNSRPTRPRSFGPTPVLAAVQSMQNIKSAPEVAPPVRANSDPSRVKGVKKSSLRRQASQKRLSNLRNDHMRQLSTIVERPSTSKSRGGESIKSRKSLFSLKKEKPPPLPEKLPVPLRDDDRKPSQGSMFSSDGSTLRGSTPESPHHHRRITSLEEVPEEPAPLTPRDPLSPLSAKPLPMTPADFPHSPTSVKSRLTRLFRSSKRSDVSLPLTMSTPTLLAPAGMKSRETLMSNASLECLRLGGRNGSKSTLLVAYQEGPDQPFQVWLNALPYIEGRAGERV